MVLPAPVRLRIGCHTFNTLNTRIRRPHKEGDAAQSRISRSSSRNPPGKSCNGILPVVARAGAWAASLLTICSWYLACVSGADDNSHPLQSRTVSRAQCCAISGLFGVRPCPRTANQSAVAVSLSARPGHTASYVYPKVYYFSNCTVPS